jgi:nitrous-oxide reductase
MKRFHRWGALTLGATMLLTAACSKPADLGKAGQGGKDGGTVTGLSADAAAIAKERGLTPHDVASALKTFVPSGKTDEAVMFASGGHSGQVIAIGIPSMRILKNIAVFTPEPWQGYGYNEDTKKILAEGRVEGKDVLWGDTHHPNLSETGGEYDGQYLFINDKANARIAVIDLKDWKTKQIVKNPLTNIDHGGAFVTPNTDYVIEGSQYALPWIGTQADISEYKDKYRGMITFWKFDREAGRIDKTKSFAIELPPYWQDLCDAGKGPSDGLIFCNSINTEMAVGKTDASQPNFEAGASARDKDYLHVIDWKKAEAVYKAGKVKEVNGFPLISMETAVAEGLVHFVPEPKSPHGSDVTPAGTHVVIGGKLDPHVSVYSVAKIKDAIANKKYESKDQFGFPVIKFEDALEAQVELGLGPLHTVFDDKGYAYTSLFLDSAVARWSLGSERKEDGWKLIHKLPVQYNIGHITALEGDTVKPKGKYVVALNKWSLDRFQTTGPLLPQNEQLVDISGEGTNMSVIYDMPMGIGEPHYAQIISADKLKNTWAVYPEVGWDAEKQGKSATATAPGQERVERNGNEVHVYMTAVRSHFAPEHIEVKQGDHVFFHITNIDKVKDAIHGFGLSEYNISLSLDPGETVNFDFIADKVGTFSYYCTEFCSALHLEMAGYLQVKP